jgi:NtrC-family two-component system sensor histidine kinase KinB
MSQNRYEGYVVAVLGILTLFAVVWTLSSVEISVISSRLVELVVYSLLTAFALILAVPIARSELSVAHAIGMMAFLSLPAEVAPAMTIAIFIGGVIGGMIRARVVRNRQKQNNHWIYTFIHICSRATLAFFVTERLYNTILRASLPIESSADLTINTLPLMIYALVYVGFYLASFTLQLASQAQRAGAAIRENFVSVVIILLLPVPFAFLGASVAQIDESVVFFTITIVGATLIIFGLFALNQSQQRLQRQLEELRSISVATKAMRGNLDMDGLLRTTYVQVSQLLDTPHFTVALHNEIEMRTTFPLVIRGGEELRITEVHGLPDDYPLIEYVMTTGLPLLIDENVKERSEELGVRPPTKPIESWLGVPIITGDKATGAFVIQSYEQRHFDEDDLRLLNIVVASTGIAIENARLYQQKSVRAEQLATLNQVTALLTGTLSPNEVLDMVVSSASTISEANAVGVYLFSEDKNDELVMARSAGLSDAFTHRPPMPVLGHSLVEKPDDFAKPQSLLVKNIEQSDMNIDSVRMRFLDERKRAFIEHPLIFGGENLGVLVLYFNKPQEFHPEQIDMIQAFCTQASQAINNAQRFASADKALEQRVEQLYVLAAMGRLLNASMETDKIYEIVLSYATDATKAPRGLVAIYRGNKKLIVAANKGFPENMFDDVSYLEQGLTGRVLHTGQSVRAGDTRLVTGYLPLLPQTRSTLIIPIMKGKDVLGIIVLESDTPGKFTEGDGHFVAQIANQAVIAVDNTLLFQRVREARDNMQAILDAMEEGIILLNQLGEIVLANPQMAMIEIKPADILDQKIETLLNHPSLNMAKRLGFADNEDVRTLLDKLKSGWEGYPAASYEIQGDNFGSRYIQRQIIPVRDEDRHLGGLLLVFYNKSEERELAAARESLSNMIVHDLRSPLTAVTTSLRLLGELVPKNTDYANLVEKTTSTSRRAIRKVLTRVDAILDISKMESGEMRLDREPSSLAQIVESVQAELKPLSDELDVQVLSEVTYSLPMLDIDADKIERMVLNLVDNALKYAPSDTVVKVRAITGDPDFVRLEIVDSGPGIPDEYKKRLFDRFVQVEGRKTVRRGVGLGLTFCKLVAEAHGGDIWVSDNPDGGSIFKATLPIAKMGAIVE